jgi:hypothetical protein
MLLIWLIQVLQEVAAARHVILKCGSTEVDGYAFCVALMSESLGLLKETSLNVQNVVHSAVYLIQGAAFRSRRVTSSSAGRFSLGIRPLGELVELYHTRKAAKLHDKVFALLGMSSDDPIAAGLSPDYTVPWDTLLERLIRYLLGQQVSIATWIDVEMAVIQSYGYVIGKVTAVADTQDQSKQEVTLLLRDQWGELGLETRWHLPPSAKSVQAGDIVCLLTGALNPTIIRPYRDYFSIIIVTAPTPQGRSLSGGQCDFLLVWDWEDVSARMEEEYYEAFMKIRRPGYLDTQSSGPEHSVKRSLNMTKTLEEAEDYQAAEDRLRRFVESNKRQSGADSSHLLECESKLASLRQILERLEHTKNQNEQGTDPHRIITDDIRERQRWVVRIIFEARGTFPAMQPNS